MKWRMCVDNLGQMARARPADISIKPLSYLDMALRARSLSTGQTLESRWPISSSDHWYDLELRNGASIWRLAGHVETGRISRSDPALG